MVRRVGFGNKEAERRPASRDTGRAGVQDPAGGIGARLFTLAFLSVWLIGWTAGIVFAANAVRASEAPFSEFFLIFWLLGAGLGWVFAVRFWWKTLTGR